MNRPTSEITNMIRGDWEELRLRSDYPPRYASLSGTPWSRSSATAAMTEMRPVTASEIESYVRYQYGLTNNDIETQFANGYGVDSFMTAAVLDAISLVDWGEVVATLERDRSVGA
jgi:hypothetical protein